MNQRWNYAVYGEQQLGLDLNESLLVKLVGSPQSPLLLISSYPKFSTACPRYGMVNDMSNVCMLNL